jgi:Ankyrin repeats (3 copies)
MEFTGKDNAHFLEALQGLQRGDFSRLAPLFDPEPALGNRPRIIAWHEKGLFEDHAEEVAEALTAASFLGKTEVMKYLLAQGIDPVGGSGTGLNALHWACNRGQLEAVRLLIQAKAPLEARNSYGGTVLGAAVYAAVHEPRPTHPQIIEELLGAGALADEVECPTGNERVDSILRLPRTS